MMRKFKLKGLKLTSPRKERNSDDHPQSPGSLDSQDDSYCTPDAKPGDSNQATPKRKSIFSTLRRKFTSGLRRSDDGRRAHTWHAENGATISGSATLPAKQISSCRAAPRRFHKPLRPAVSEERLPMDDRSPEFLRKFRIQRKGEPINQAKIEQDFFLKRENSSSEESEKEESQHDEDGKVLLPMDTEYGHASAPSSNEQSAVLATSSSEGNTPPSNNGLPCSEHGEEEPRHTMQACRSSQHDHEHPLESVEKFQVQCIPPPHNRTRSVKPWSLTDELFRLSKYGWYWGPITRVEAEEKLANQPDGSFLVRDSSDERYLLSLSFRSYGRTLHTRIEHCNGVFSFYAQPECEGYKSVVSLIHHSMTDSQTGVFCYSRARTPGAPSFPVRLTKPVSRFTHVRSLQYLCRFVIRQNTRYDHIQKLPLPTSIKGWLEENQY